MATLTKGRRKAIAPGRLATDNPDAGLSKGERTRQRLLDSGRILLERDGYHAIRVSDVAAQAGLSSGVFYIYFRDKDELAIELFRTACKEAIGTIYAERAPAGDFAAVLHTLRRYIDIMLDSGGMIRAVVQILDQLPDARAIWLDMNSLVARRIAVGMAHRAPDDMRSDAARIITAHAAQAMIDSMLLSIVSYDNADLRDMARSRERLAQTLSVLWYRLLYGASPDPSEAPLALDFLPAG
ncbi:TetR/AcrR family transcriptional regulator [Sphingomonas sp. 28-63-12]|uniref:TetR/AcrR family transcriptional regulator n=1 Tax=Sphingomonas sp. 28-63-12 TaxID=1970434 RepID=UPI0035A870BC